jgi:hypothetical protein
LGRASVDLRELNHIRVGYDPAPEPSNLSITAGCGLLCGGGASVYDLHIIDYPAFGKG